MSLFHRAAGGTAILATLVLTTAATAAAPKLSVRAAKLTQQGTSWTGAVQSPQLGAGKLTLTGKVVFLDHAIGDPTPHVLQFHASFKKGSLSGCLFNSTYLRPGNRQVWDGGGRITATSRSLHRYKGLRLSDGGQTPADDLTTVAPFRIDYFAHGGGC